MGKEPRLRDIQGALGKKNKNPLDDWVDKPNLANYFAKDEETITNWQKEEGLPFAKVGRETFFSLNSVAKWLKDREMTLVPEDQEQKKGAIGKGSRAPEIGAN